MIKILIVDDNESFLYYLENCLDTYYSVYTTSRIKDLRKTIIKVNPDIVLMDVFMNKYDGRELINTVKYSITGREIPVIITSGNPYALKNFGDLGAIDFIDKKEDVSFIINKINHYLNHSLNKAV